MDKEKFLFEAVLKSKEIQKATDDSEEKRIIEGFVATTDKDTDGDVIEPDALKEAAEILLKQYNTLLYNHNRDKPIGKIIDAAYKELDNRAGLWVKSLISKTENEIWTKVQEGVLSKFSFWAYVTRQPVFREDEEGNQVIDYYRITKIFPYEASLVSVPANPNAVALDWYIEKAFKGEKQEMEKDVNKEKEKITKAENDKPKPKVKIDNSEVSHTPWSKVNKTRIGQILAESGNERAIKEAFAVVPDVEKRSTWKFPHHELQKEGDNEYVLILSYTGLMAFYKALQGARNKPKLSQTEYNIAVRHARKHFRQLIQMGEYDEMPEGLKSKVQKAIEWLDNEIKEPLTKEEVMEGLKELIAKMKEVEGEELKSLLEEAESLVEELPEKKEKEEVKVEVDVEEIVNKTVEKLKDILKPEVKEKEESEEETKKEKEGNEVEELIKSLKEEIESLKKEIDKIKETPIVKGQDTQREEEELTPEEQLKKEIESEEFAKKSPAEQLAVLRKFFDNK